MSLPLKGLVVQLHLLCSSPAIVGWQEVYSQRVSWPVNFLPLLAGLSAGGVDLLLLMRAEGCLVP
jgi:hypothetical protein